MPAAGATLVELPRAAVGRRDDVGIEPLDECVAMRRPLRVAVDEEHRMSRLERREIRDDRLEGVGALDHHEPPRRAELVATRIDAIAHVAVGQRLAV